VALEGAPAGDNARVKVRTSIAYALFGTKLARSSSLNRRERMRGGRKRDSTEFMSGPSCFQWLEGKREGTVGKEPPIYDSGLGKH